MPGRFPGVAGERRAGSEALGTPTALLTVIGHDARGRTITQRLQSSVVSLLKESWSLGATSTAEAVLRPDACAEYTFNIRWQFQNLLEAPAASHLHIGSIATTDLLRSCGERQPISPGISRCRASEIDWNK